jgi:hypothetical protein
MMFDMTMTFSSSGVMGSIMRWDVGGVVLVYRDTMFFEDLSVSGEQR